MFSGNLPPLSYDHFDVSKLLRDLEIVRNEVNFIKYCIPSTLCTKNVMQNSVTADNIQQSKTEGDGSHDDGIDQQFITLKGKSVDQYVSTVSNTANLSCDKPTTTNQMTFAQKVSKIPVQP